MESCTLGALAGVFVGWALGAGARPRMLERALGSPKVSKLVRLLELLEEPPPDEDDETRLEDEAELE